MTRNPRYVEGLGLRPHAAGIDVVGGPATLRLKRPTRQAEILGVVDLIRSGHSLDEAAVILGQPVEAIDAWVAPLVRTGVLTHAAPTNTGASRQMVRYLERTLGVQAAATALHRLAEATVCLHGDAGFRRAMAALLKDCGVTTLDDLPPDVSGRVLLVRGGPTPPDDGVGSVVPTLFVTPTSNGMLVGPLCNVPGGRCSHCCRPCRAGDIESSAGVSDAASFEVGLAVAAGEVVRWLAGMGYCRTSGGAIEVRGGGTDQTFKAIFRDPTCTQCGIPDGLPADAVGAYQTLQTVDVPVKENWSPPLRAVQASSANSTINVYSVPSLTLRIPERTGAFGVVTDVFAPLSVARSGWLSVAGADLLNVFLCHRDDSGAYAAYLLDRRRGMVRPIPTATLPQRFPLPDGRLTVIVAATLNRAEMIFGSRAFLTVHQDTGYALGTLRSALAGHGFSVRSRLERSLPGDVMHAFGLDPGRDRVTAVVDVPLRPDLPVPRPSRRARRTRRAVDLADLAAMLATGTGDGGEVLVRWRGTGGIDAECYRWSDGRLDAARLAGTEVDDALRERGLDLDAFVVFTTDIGRTLAEQGRAGIDTCVMAQARAAQELHRTARERGFDAMVFADLPSTALVPDGRGWRSAYRSFAAVGIAAPGSLGDAAGSAVLW
ncbi:hypothetical protein [Micromonospora andamanensis]|uniref:hypothetical protein n=1 Tax=Micromonospora andamanensis TaxID=1287068 RepID=UPI001951F94A|nr:hypothetical protein [Micromonospora andamanensis]